MKSKKCKFNKAGIGARIYKNEKCARKFAGNRGKRHGYNPSVYESTRHEWVVIY